ncbi:hypothetical protein GFY24_01620 [Nocardia sp. SYP-A9097]|uniref:hypothetical protein n=1 Tax=Nocardia sp. SYP-A9097 TaxID=2663237 RepID=UPI00129BDAEE|nr:hypothetical protein [Nocardia sp. SYP-A9097]MRH86174.1 hypothetical protein [Nocardia sp. SYP-A9097]
MPVIVVTGGDSFLPSSMNKSGTLPIPLSYADVTGWTADTAGYPGSTLSGNGLRNQGAKLAATITATLVFSGGNSGSLIQQAKIMVNNVAVGAPGSATGASGTLIATATTSLVDGDIVTVQAVCNAGLAAWASTIQVAGSSLRIT